MSEGKKDLYYDWGTPAYLQQEDKPGFDTWRVSALTMKHPAKDRLWVIFSTTQPKILSYDERWDALLHGYYIHFYRPILRYKKVVLLYKYLIATMGVLPLPRDLYPVVARFLIY
jgi:hypothetical protein